MGGRDFRKSVCRLKAVLSRAHFRYRAQGRGSSLARDNPFFLSAVVVAFGVEAPWILGAQDRVQAVGAHHVVAQVHPHPCIWVVVTRWRVDRCGRQRYPRVRVVTFTVEPLGQRCLWEPAKKGRIRWMFRRRRLDLCKLKVVKCTRGLIDIGIDV